MSRIRHLTRRTAHVINRPASLPLVLMLLLAAAAPIRASAQAAPPISTLESELTAAEWPVRARAVSALTDRPREITAAGLTRLIELLRSELDGTMPDGDGEGEEAFGEYIMMLTHLITRFDDARATPVLARQGIALVNGAMFHVAMAGDAAIAPLIGTWNENENLRPAVVRTLAHMRFYADSTNRSISTGTRATIDDYLLLSSNAEAEWLRRAFVDAVGTVRDPAFLPLIREMAANDPAEIDGMRYVSRDASRLLPALEQRQSFSTPASLLQALREREESACRIGWIVGAGICTSLEMKMQGAADALARGQPLIARNQLEALLAELAAQRGRGVNEAAYLLIAGNAAYLISRM
jgi:hypothetical protein